MRRWSNFVRTLSVLWENVSLICVNKIIILKLKKISLNSVMDQWHYALIMNTLPVPKWVSAPETRCFHDALFIFVCGQIQKAKFEFASIDSSITVTIWLSNVEQCSRCGSLLPTFLNWLVYPTFFSDKQNIR